VIIADCSQCPIHPQLKPVFHQYARKQSEVVTAHGARYAAGIDPATARFLQQAAQDTVQEYFGR